MTTFKQFLRREQAQTAADLIRRDCKPFLRAIKGKGLLYRGIKISAADARDIIDGEYSENAAVTLPDNTYYYVKSVRQDRKPLSMVKQLYDRMDSWFKRKLGFAARSNAMFAFGEGSSHQTASYGSRCVVFPIGPIQYAWSPNVRDLYIAAPRDLNDASQEEVDQWLEDKGYKNTDLDDAVVSISEIMVKCNKYYAFPVKFTQDLKKELGIE